MTLARKIFVIFLSLMVVLIATSFLLPRHVHVERDAVLKASPKDVFPYVNDFRAFNQWSPWAKIDPATRYSFDGSSHGVGATMAWQSEHPNVGKGRQEILESIEPEIVKVALEFDGEIQATAFYRLSAEPAGTRLVWGFETDLGNNPISRYFGLFFDDMIGGDYEKGLSNLKALVEKQG